MNRNQYGQYMTAADYRAYAELVYGALIDRLMAR